MAFLTNDPSFTNREDVRISFDGWIISSGVGVDALGGGGTVDLGRGDDVLRGFGGGSFIGGSGLDALTFSSGTYRIEGVEGQREVF